MKLWAVMIMIGGIGCVDAVTHDFPQQGDLGMVDDGEVVDLSPDLIRDTNKDSDIADLDPHSGSPWCDGDSRTLIRGIGSEHTFTYPPLGPYTRDISGPVWKVAWEHGFEEYSSNLVAVVGEEGVDRSMKGIWLPFGADLNFRLADYYPYKEPEIVPEYLAVTVLVDHQSVEATYEWDWKGRNYEIRSFFMSVAHQTTQYLDVKIPSEVFPVARAYEIAVLFFKPNAIQTQLVQIYRMTLYYGSFDIPEHPCVPLPEAVELTEEEAAYEELTASIYPRNEISIYHQDPAESTERDSVIEVDKNATSVQMNVLLRGTKRENFVHEHVPMKIVTFVDYVAQEESILIGLPQETRKFAHRDKVEIRLNPGPETIVWMVGIYNPWIPPVSWDNRVNYDIQRLYWAYKSNRVIFRRSE